MADNPYHGKIQNKGSMVLDAIHPQPKAPKPEKLKGTDLRAGKK